MTDDELVKFYVQGNSDAFDVLLDRYQGKLFSYIYFAVKNRDVADDLFQETFVKAIVTIQQGKYTDNGKFSAWLTRIAHNLVIDYFRQVKNENTVSNDESEVDLFNESCFTDENIETKMIIDQSLKDVKTLMELLPDNQRDVVYMRYYQDLSFKEIADITGVSINTALGRMRYALLNMRRIANDNNLFLSIS